MKYILYLPSWYPNKLDLFTGDFIQRHAKALSIFSHVHVFFIVRDTEKKITRSIKIEEYDTGNLKETIIYYSGITTSMKILDRLLSVRKYNRIFKDYFLEHINRNGFPLAVHVHVPYKAGLIALWLKRKYGIEYYVTEHWTGYDLNSHDNYLSRPASFRYIIKKVFKEAKCIMPVSNDLGKKISKIIPGVNIKIIPNVVDTKLFFYKGDKIDKFQFAHYTSLQMGQKNTIGLINALAELRKSPVEWNCIIYGPVDPVIVKMISTFGLSNYVICLGEVSYTEVASILRSSSAFISFSNFENQPCSILEALCCGLPVIATNVGGVPELISESNGLLVQAGNESELLQAMGKMISTNKSYNREEIARQAKEKYSYESVGKMLLAIYQGN